MQSEVISVYLPICDEKILPNESADYTPSVPFLSEVGCTEVLSGLASITSCTETLFPHLQVLCGCILVVERYESETSHIFIFLNKKT